MTNPSQTIAHKFCYHSHSRHRTQDVFLEFARILWNLLYLVRTQWGTYRRQWWWLWRFWCPQSAGIQVALQKIPAVILPRVMEAALPWTWLTPPSLSRPPKARTVQEKPLQVIKKTNTRQLVSEACFSSFFSLSLFLACVCRLGWSTPAVLDETPLSRYHLASARPFVCALAWTEYIA